MSFLFDVSPRPHSLTPVPIANGSHLPPSTEALNQDLSAKRSTLLGEKLKLHARIIDEFNITLLAKLPREEFVKQANGYVANYVRTESISLNQKEVEVVSEEIIDEATSYGPSEPWLK